MGRQGIGYIYIYIYTYTYYIYIYICIYIYIYRLSGKRDSVHRRLLEVVVETATVPESRQKLL